MEEYFDGAGKGGGRLRLVQQLALYFGVACPQN